MKVLLALALALPVGSPSAAESLNLDQSVSIGSVVSALRAKAGIPEDKTIRPSAESEEEDVWITISRDDVKSLGDKFNFPQRRPIRDIGVAALYRLKVTELPELSRVMHEEFHKCGGYFAHTSLGAAEQHLTFTPAAAPAAAYSIDQGAVVRPLTARVDPERVAGTIKTLAAYNNRYYQAETGVASSRWIADRWKALVQGRSDAAVELVKHGGWAQESVILTLKGTAEPGKVVVLGGHADSIAGFWGGSTARAPGADDNASGIAVLTETIRVLAESGYRPRKTLKFMAYAAEEVGLRGSKEIALDFKREGVQVEGVIQFDMTAYNGSSEDIFLIADHTDAGQNAFLGRLIDEYTKFKWSTTKCGYACSDHASWTSSGFRASFPFEASHEDHNRAIHSARDTLETAGGSGLHAAKFAELAIAFAVETAKTGEAGLLTRR